MNIFKINPSTSTHKCGGKKTGKAIALVKTIVHGHIVEVLEKV